MGPKSKKQKTNKNINNDDFMLEFRRENDDEDYGRIVKMLGNGRANVYSFFLKREIQCHIRGNIKGKLRKHISVGTFVLISIRNLNGELTQYKKSLKEGLQPNNDLVFKGDILLFYNEKDVRDLEKSGEFDYFETSEKLFFNTINNENLHVTTLTKNESVDFMEGENEFEQNTKFDEKDIDFI